MTAALGTMVDRALGADWPILRRRLPPHIRSTLPARPPGGSVGRTMAQMALRARRTWIANGRPAGATPDLRQLEQDWAVIVKLESPEAELPEKASRDKVSDVEKRTMMLEAAPDYPKPSWLGAIPAELIEGWLRHNFAQRLGEIPARSVATRDTRFPVWKNSNRVTGGHGERHENDFGRFDFDWVKRGLATAIDDHEKRAFAVVWGIVDSLNGDTARDRGNGILTARDYLTQLGLPGSELAIWLRDTVTAAAKGGGGRRTVNGTMDLVLDATRRAELAKLVEKSGDSHLARRIRGEQGNPFRIGYDRARGFYYHFNVIGAHDLVKDRRCVNGVDVFWDSYISKVAR